MRYAICVAAWLMAIGAAVAQAQQCSQDSQGNQVCVSTQPNQYACGCLDMFGACHFMLVYCRDVAVKKTAPSGEAIYTHVLGGESDQVPGPFVFDAQNDVILLGTTYSKQFPTTPGAIQSTNAGPTAPYSTYGSLPSPGGDLFLSILSTSGDLLYSTFLGSSGNDTILGVRAATNSQVEVLTAAGGSNFPVVPAAGAPLNGGPVLFTFDTVSRTLVRSGYLPITSAGAATLQSDGTVSVTTAGGLYTFGPDGQQRSFVSLASFAFASVPETATDPSGDFWLVGPNTSQQFLVAKLTGGTVAAFRWTLPLASGGSPYLLPPFFGPDGLAYLAGAGNLLTTTPNALLEAPCPRFATSIVAVLSAQGDLKLLSYLPDLFSRFSAAPDGTVFAGFIDGGTQLIDLSQRPKAACVADVLNRFSSPPPSLGVGEIVRLQGGGFGPSALVSASLGTNRTYPTSLNGLSVQVAGIAAPILSAGPGVVVFAIPYATPDGDTIPVTVQDNEQQSAAFPIAVRASAPWLIDPIENADGTPNSFSTPASWGSVVTLYVTGAGPYSPPLNDGQAAPLDTSHQLQLPVSVAFLIAGPSPQPATILYAGPAPGLVGVAQINVQLPSSAPYSSFSTILTIGSVSEGLPSIWLQ